MPYQVLREFAVTNDGLTVLCKPGDVIEGDYEHLANTHVVKVEAESPVEDKKAKK